MLELVFEQEQFTSCEQILGVCVSGRARLVLPAYSFAEPHDKLHRQAKARKELRPILSKELNELARTASYPMRVNSLRDIETLLIQSGEDEKQRFILIRDRLLKSADIIPLTNDVIIHAALYERKFDLSPQDALIYASVVAHLRHNTATTNCFLNKNRKDFDNPDIVEELKGLNCRMIPRFDHGCGFISSHLTS